MTKSLWITTILLGVVGLLVLATAYYPLIGLWQTNPQMVINRSIFALGTILSFFGIVMLIPKKALIVFLSFFSSEIALKNQQAYGISGNLSGYSSNLAFLFKLNSYKFSKLIGIVILIVSGILIVNFY